jgi:serine/threonine protein kinase/tetratricopeptide (TPR) repeat protein
MTPTDLSARDPVEVLAEEFCARQRRGERPTLDEYADSHPDLADRIRAVFPALMLLEELGPKPAAPAAVPERLGEFRILREVGRGGMGVVYDAVQEPLGRRVALKVLSSHMARDGAYLARFQREARTAARLHHTHIVPVYGVGEQGGVHFLAMQLIRGVGLDTALATLRRPSVGAETPGPATTPAGGAPPGATPTAAPPTGSPVHQLAHLHRTDPAAYVRAVADLVAQAADGLAYAHAHGVVHRDVKPGNLLLDEQGTVWVSDFGLAKAEDGGDLTQPGFVVGTPRYLAPERFEGKDTPAGDVYALGATLYELLTLWPVFDGADRDRLLERIRTQEPVRPRAVCPHLPRDLETVCLKALAKEPGRRYTAAELAADLRRFLDGRPVRARRVGPVERLARWARRNPTIAGLTAGLFVALASGLIVSLAFWRLAETHATDAHNQFVHAEQQRDLAQERLADALQAVDTYFTQVSESRLLNVPGVQPLRKELLQTAVTYYQKYLEQGAGDPALRRETARTHWRLGKLYSLLGPAEQAIAHFDRSRDLWADEVRAAPTVEARRELSHAYIMIGAEQMPSGHRAEARTAYDAALAILNPLCAEQPDDGLCAESLARALYGLGYLHEQQPDLDNAIACWQQAADLMETWHHRLPERTGPAELLARLCNGLATARKTRGDMDGALALFDRARALLTDMLQTRPNQPDLQRSLAGVESNSGNLLLAQHRPAEAVVALRRARDTQLRLCRANPHWLDFRLAMARDTIFLCHAYEAVGDLPAAADLMRRSVEELERLVEDDENNATFRLEWGQHWAELGKVCHLQQRPDDAIAAIDRAVAIYEEIVRRSQPVVFYFSVLSHTLGYRAKVLIEQGRRGDALETYQRAAVYQRRAVEMRPQSQYMRKDMGFRHYDIGRMLRELGRPAEAADALAEAVPLFAGEAPQLTDVARELALCIPAATTPEQKEHWAGLAVQALRNAAAAGLTDRVAVRDDPAFVPLRERADFRAVFNGSESGGR